LLPRLLFLAVLGGGLLWWAEQRRPRDLQLAIDLTSALPGEVTGLDVVVRRAGHALARHEVSYGPAGAPGTLQMIVHASPGEVEVETTLSRAGKPGQKVLYRARLSAGEPATVRVQ
jgi:hypothetical protein